MNAMQETFGWDWVEEQVERSAEAWSECAAGTGVDGPVFSAGEQEKREAAYDRALSEAEHEARRARGLRTHAGRLAAQERVTASFARFAAVALGLEGDAVELLTKGFLPAGVEFAQRARRFDGALSTADIVQAMRNAWTAYGLQPLLDEPMRITPSVVGYSLLYPYSDNYLDSDGIGAAEKLSFSRRFLERLRGDSTVPVNEHERAVWDLVAMVEGQYPRECYPQVYECMIAIHRAQEASLAQVKREGDVRAIDVLRISCAKGGTSVLADACLCRGWLKEEEAEFAFDWGVMLQLGDDLQDVREDLRRGSSTLFTRSVASGLLLDGLTVQLLMMSDRVSSRMGRMPHGGPALKRLLRMSWRSLIVMAVANAHEFFSPAFAQAMERQSPFRFEFLRKRQRRVEGRRGLYASLFDAFLEPRDDADPLGAYYPSEAVSASL